MPPRPSPILRRVLRAPQALYQHRLGWLLGRRFLMLEHVGRNSGTHYRTVVEVIQYKPSSGAAVVMSGLGRTSDWFRNVEAVGHAKITVGRRTTMVHACVLDDRDAAAAVADYEKRNRLILPILRPVLSKLAGFKYDGTEDSQLALVRQLPVVRFTPAPSTGDP